jgi:hypothetical protein
MTAMFIVIESAQLHGCPQSLCTTDVLIAHDMKLQVLCQGVRCHLSLALPWSQAGIAHLDPLTHFERWRTH